MLVIGLVALAAVTAVLAVVGMVLGRRLAASRAELSAARGELAGFGGQLARLRHDVRGMLSPVLLVADRLSLHGDPEVTEAAHKMVALIERAADRLKEG